MSYCLKNPEERQSADRDFRACFKDWLDSVNDDTSVRGMKSIRSKVKHKVNEKEIKKNIIKLNNY